EEEAFDTRAYLMTLAEDILDSLVDTYAAREADFEQWDLEGLKGEVGRVYGIAPSSWDFPDRTSDEIRELLWERIKESYDEKEKLVGRDVLQRVERDIMLQIVDTQWKDHLYSLDHLKEGMGLRGYGQADPLVEYKKESFELFQAMKDRVDEEIVRYLWWLRPVLNEEAAVARPVKRTRSPLILTGGSEAAPPSPFGPSRRAAAPAQAAAAGRAPGPERGGGGDPRVKSIPRDEASRRLAETTRVRAEVARSTRNATAQCKRLRVSMELKTEAPTLLSIETGLATALTFDDVLLVPRHTEIVPTQVDVSTWLTRNFPLNVPLGGAAMDTVTESRLAIAMAQHGGLGVIHKNLSIEEQASEVDRVKRSESGMIVNPITLSPTHRIYEALELMKKYRISGVPITEDGSKEGRLVGILTNRDLRFETNVNRPISEVMTHEELITVPVGTTLDAAREILHEHKVEKLLVVDDQYRLKGLITVKDIQKAIKYPNACKDSLGRLRCGAAIGVARDTLERAEALVGAHVDVLVVDTAHGHSQNVLDMVRHLRRRFSDVDLVAGNVATAEATDALIGLGVDAVKVGIGAGSICTTRVIAGIGVPMITAVMECARAAAAHDIPVIAAGGIRYSGDVTKAIAVGASTTMIENLFAGTDESPGELILYQGRSFKVSRGMGALGPMRPGRRGRHFQDDFDLDAPGGTDKLVPEGIEGRVAHKGSVAAMVHQLVGGLRAGMGYCGCANIPMLQRDAKLIRITPAGVRESHVHDVAITKEAPNYRSEEGLGIRVGGP